MCSFPRAAGRLFAFCSAAVRASRTKKWAGFRHSGGKCKIKGEDFQSGFTKRLHWRKTIAQSFTSILRGHGRGGAAVGVQSWCSQGKHSERPRAEKVPGIWKTVVLRKSEENMMKTGRKLFAGALSVLYIVLAAGCKLAKPTPPCRRFESRPTVCTI